MKFTHTVCGRSSSDRDSQFFFILLVFLAVLHIMRDLTSWTRARTRVPCIGRRILNHWATREVPNLIILTINQLFPLGLVLSVSWLRIVSLSPVSFLFIFWKLYH